MPDRTKIIAYVAPMALFVGLLAAMSALKNLHGHFWLASSEYWVYPLQTFLCVLLLLRYRSCYALGRPAQLPFTILIGVLVFVTWISPQQFLGFPGRVNGFNPDLFSSQPALYWLTVSFRFLRLVIVVPLVEEIFWRGFLLRFLIDENFERVLFGTFSWVSFVVVSLLFGLSHSTEDWIPAILTGAIYNVVAYRTKSLSSCVLVHAITNLLLGLWIMRTKEWGFW